MVTVGSILHNTRLWNKTGRSNIIEFVFQTVVSACHAAAADASAAVVNAVGVSATAFYITVSCNGKWCITFRGCFWSIHYSVGIHTVNRIL